MRMMPTLMTLAGMNKDSEGSRKDLLNEPRCTLKRTVMSMQLRRKSTILKIKNALPIVSRPVKRKGTASNPLLISSHDGKGEGVVLTRVNNVCHPTRSHHDCEPVPFEILQSIEE